MLIVGFPAGAFQTNCYVVASGAGSACIVVDPGQEAVEPLTALLAEHRLTPIAVLLTHGHLDHTFSVTPVCDGHDVPAYIHPEDRELLADPLKGFSPQAAAFFGADLPSREPREVRTLDDGGAIELAGVTLTVDHAPGHTPVRCCSARSPTRARPSWSPATRCSPDRSAAPTCPVVTTSR